MTGNQQNINLIKRLFEEVFNRGNLSLIDELISNNILMHDPASPNPRGGIKAFKDLESNYQRAFPNKKTKIEDIMSADDKVIVRWSCQGIHKGDLQGISATNNQVNVTGISIYKLANGKISEIWQSWDRLGLLEQLGEIQPAHALH